MSQRTTGCAPAHHSTLDAASPKPASDYVCEHCGAEADDLDQLTPIATYQPIGGDCHYVSEFFVCEACRSAAEDDPRRPARGYSCKQCFTQMVWPPDAMTNTPAVCPSCGWTWGTPVLRPELGKTAPTRVLRKADEIRRLLAEMESEAARGVAEIGTSLTVAAEDRASLQLRYDVACEIIANHLDGGNTDRARCLVERECARRLGFVERAAS